MKGKRRQCAVIRSCVFYPAIMCLTICHRVDSAAVVGAEARVNQNSSTHLRSARFFLIILSFTHAEMSRLFSAASEFVALHACEGVNVSGTCAFPSLGGIDYRIFITFISSRLSYVLVVPPASYGTSIHPLLSPLLASLSSSHPSHIYTYTCF